MQDNRILNTLRTANATLVVLVLALCAQIPHAADVFRLIPYIFDKSKPAYCGLLDCPAEFVHSYLFAIALELAVLLFVVRNKQNESYGFAAVSIAMNLAYYHLHGVWLFGAQALPAWLVSVALPAAIALYSHAVVDGHAEQPQRQPRTVRTVRQSERTEQLAVYAEQPTEQPVTIDAEQTTDLASAPNEHKRRYLEQLLASDPKPNKTQLAKTLGVGRTTLYSWIEELSPVEATR